MSPSDEYTLEFILSLIWLSELEMLAWKYSGDGYKASFEGCNLLDLWEQYTSLKRKDNGR